MAVLELAEQIGPEPMACVIVFVSPRYNLKEVSAALNSAFPDTQVVGCTTAGEIGASGYMDETIVAIGLPREDFNIQLFGGSAGDGMDFERTYVLSDGQVISDAAVLMLVRTRCPVRVFRYDNFVPTDTRMIVTDADPAQRIVKEINAEPAAREYARLVGKDPDQLSPFIFASHPVVVRVGGQHHVRAIQQVDETGHLRFFSEIHEGMVLTVASGQDIASHLDEALSSLTTDQKPASIIACDCMLRRLDAQQQQATPRVSSVLSKHGVIGFSTYGEQHNSMHVNQTFTGVAIYPPEAEHG